MNKTLKLDIGCGGRGSMYPDFIGIDKHPEPRVKRTTAPYLQLDFVLQPHPWQPGTVDEIVAFHIIEHLKYEEGQILLRRAYDLLKPGAQMFVTCPDFELFATMYLKAKAGDKEAIQFWQKKYPKGKDMWPGETVADRFNNQIHEFTHEWQYDQESLIHAAKKAGCRQVEPMPIERLGYPETHFWSRRPDHEVGIIVTKI